MAVGQGSILRATGAVKAEKAGTVENKILVKEDKTQPKAYLEEIAIDSLQPLPKEWEKIHKTKVCSKEFQVSIEKYGVLEPILVYRTGEKEYRILSGYKRVNAAKIAKRENLLAIVCSVETETTAKEKYKELHAADTENAVLPKNFGSVTPVQKISNQTDLSLPVYLL